MPLNDIDLVRRHCSLRFPIDLVDIIVYIYNEQIFEEKHIHTANELIHLLENDNENNDDKSYWIEIINRSRIFFQQSSDLYLLLKIISWSGKRVQQQQISFYVKSSKNILITFQEEYNNDNQSIFDTIKSRLRQSESSSTHRLKQMNVDYLFYRLFDIIIEKYINVIEEIGDRIDHYDEKLMADKQSLTLDTLHSIYRLRHDLLHLRILCNPLIDIVSRLQRITEDERFFASPHSEPLLRLDLKHHLTRRTLSSARHSPRPLEFLSDPTEDLIETPSGDFRRSSIFPTENIYIYFSDLNDHITKLIDGLEIQRESVAMLISFWVALNNDDTQEILKILMLVTVLFMPCVLLTGIHSTNFQTQPEYGYKYGYYIILIALATLLTIMGTWYKLKRWI